MLEAILKFLWLSPMPLWVELIVRVVAWGLIVAVVAVILWSLIKYLCNIIRVLLGRKDSSPQQRSLFSYFIVTALLITFGGFAYMHYHTVGNVQGSSGSSIDAGISNSTVPQLGAVRGSTNTKVEPIIPSPESVDMDTRIKLFDSMLSDNDRATSRVFALVTVLIAAATLIVALQFIVNTRMMKELELKSKNIEKEFQDKQSKLSRIEDAIIKVESLAQATSYPLRINTKSIAHYKTRSSELEEYGKWISDSFDKFNVKSLEDEADWNSILFLARQAHASLQADDTKTCIERLVAVAACKAESCTGDREEKSILLTLAIDTFEAMDKIEPDDTVNLASAYARKGMLYACLPDSYDYKQADRLFEDITSAISKEKNELAQDAFFNWGISWLARAAIFNLDSENGNKASFRKAKQEAENYLKEANALSETGHMADYALLTLYSISKEKKQCEKIIACLEKQFSQNINTVPLPKLYRIKEDIDLKFIKNVDERLYARLANLTEKNDAKERSLKRKKSNGSESDMEA